MVSMCLPILQLELTLSELSSTEWRALHPPMRHAAGLSVGPMVRLPLNSLLLQQ